MQKDMSCPQAGTYLILRHVQTPNFYSDMCPVPKCVLEQDTSFCISLLAFRIIIRRLLNAKGLRWKHEKWKFDIIL